jgi:hypothetical protein
VNDPGPDVIVDFVFDRGLFFIELSNIGDSPAFDITVAFDKNIRGVEGTKSVSSQSMFTSTAFMPPGKKITTFLDKSASYFLRGEPTIVRTSVEFSDRDRQRHSNVITHNLGIYRDIGYILGREES